MNKVFLAIAMAFALACVACDDPPEHAGQQLDAENSARQFHSDQIKRAAEERDRQIQVEQQQADLERQGIQLQEGDQ